MNREIRFRGKTGHFWDTVSPDDYGWELFWNIVDRDTVGQYIGRKDSSGREIFEGDILKDGSVVEYFKSLV